MSWAKRALRARWRRRKLFASRDRSPQARAIADQQTLIQHLDVKVLPGNMPMNAWRRSVRRCCRHFVVRAMLPMK